MWCGVISVFPDMFEVLKQNGITGKAVSNGLLELQTWNLRQFASDKHRTVDDRPFGGGPGMLLMPQPLKAAIRAAKDQQPTARVIYVSPSGKRFDHQMARRLAILQQPLIFVAGRYEGIDQRIIDEEIDEQISIGDYVLSGGELAVMVIVDAITRWIPGALGHEGSAPNDAFTEENEGLLDCPHFTRPAVFEDATVPDVLLKGDHQAIALWRKKQALGQTWLYRPDLLAQKDLSEQQKKLLNEFQQEYKGESS